MTLRAEDDVLSDNRWTGALLPAGLVVATLRNVTLRTQMLVFLVLTTSSLTACVSLAPGANNVRLTKAASEVTGCTAVGNISVPRDANGQPDIANADAEFRNQVVGLGGNTGFITSEPLGVPVEGIAYRCP
jgi:hypothetical protein